VDKLDELSKRLNLVKSYKKQKYEDIQKYNEILFGKIDKKLVKLSKEKILDTVNDGQIL